MERILVEKDLCVLKDMDTIVVDSVPLLLMYPVNLFLPSGVLLGASYKRLKVEPLNSAFWLPRKESSLRLLERIETKTYKPGVYEI